MQVASYMTPRRSVGKGVQANLNVRVNMQGWWRYHVGLTNTSGKCSSWLDSSNNSHPLVQATASKQPTILSDGSLLFDGANSTITAAFTLVQPFTLYMAFQQVTWTSGDIILDGSTGTTKVTQTGSSPALAMNAGSALTGDSTIAVGNYGVIACVFNSTTSVYQAAGGAASVTTTGDASTGNPGGITIGSDRSGANNANIAVKEVIVYSVAHDATTRLQIMRYLGRVANVGGIT